MIAFFRWVGLEGRAQLQYAWVLACGRRGSLVRIREFVIGHLQPLPDGLLDAVELLSTPHVSDTERQDEHDRIRARWGWAA